MKTLCLLVLLVVACSGSGERSFGTAGTGGHASVRGGASAEVSELIDAGCAMRHRCRISDAGVELPVEPPDGAAPAGGERVDAGGESTGGAGSGPGIGGQTGVGGGTAGTGGEDAAAGSPPVNCPPGYHVEDGVCVGGCEPLSFAEACDGRTCGVVDNGCGDDVNCGLCSPFGPNSGVGNVCEQGACTVIDLPPNPARATQYDADCSANDPEFPEGWLYGTSGASTCVSSGALNAINPDLVCCAPTTPCQEAVGIYYNCQGVTPPAGCPVLVMNGRQTYHYDCR